MRNFKHAQQDVFSSITVFFLIIFVLQNEIYSLCWGCRLRSWNMCEDRISRSIFCFLQRFQFSVNVQLFAKKTSSLKNKQKNSIYFFARRQFLHKVDYILQLSRQAIQYLHHRSILNFFARNSFIYVGFIYFVSRIFSELIIYISWFIIIWSRSWSELLTAISRFFRNSSQLWIKKAQLNATSSR